MGRYTLRAYDNKSKKEQIVKILENGKYKNKLDIATIDIFLLENARYGLKNDEMLKSEEDGKKNVIDYLNDTIFSDNPSIQQKLSQDTFLYITYEMNGRKYLEPIYKSDNLLNIAKEFDQLRKKFLQYQNNHPNISRSELKKTYAEIFQNITDKPFFSNWLKMFYGDLKNRSVSHDISSDRQYLNLHLKQAIMSLIYALPYENADMETYEANKNIYECKKEVEKCLTSYKQVRGLIILKDQYWDKIATIEQNRLQVVSHTPKYVGKQDVLKIQKVLQNAVYEKDNTDNKSSIVRTINHATGKQTYLDHFDEDYEEILLEDKEEELLSDVNILDEKDDDIVETTLNGKTVYIDHVDENAWTKRKKK